MSEKKLFTDRRWTDIPGFEVIEGPPISEEEKQRRIKESEAFFKMVGVLKEDEKIEDFMAP